MPFQEFHRGQALISGVISDHKIMAERELLHSPGEELRHSFGYLDVNDPASIHRFLGAMKTMVGHGEAKQLVGSGAVAGLMVLAKSGNEDLTMGSLSVVIEMVSRDRNGVMSREIHRRGGSEVLLDLIVYDGGEKSGMIRANSLYSLGYMIGNGVDLLDPSMVDVFLELTHSDDHVIRCNALFCFRMSLEQGPVDWMDHQRVFDRALEMLSDREVVVKEALRLMGLYLEEDMVEEGDLPQKILEMDPENEIILSREMSMITGSLAARGIDIDQSP